MGEDDRKYLWIGDQTLDAARRLAGLHAHSDVLDVGCGYGRLAHAILRWGEFHGTYSGIDILPRHLAWAKENLGREGIEFDLLDVQNDRYNPDGSMQPDNVSFEGSYDHIVLASVFTHLWPRHIAAYLRALARVLRPDGRIFATFFLLDDAWDRLRTRDLPREFSLPHEVDDHTRIEDPENPLHVVAVRLEWVERAAGEAGLRLARAPEYGRWSGRNGRQTLQDAVVFAHRRPGEDTWRPYAEKARRAARRGLTAP